MTGGGKERINGETIAGMALIVLALTFIWAGTRIAIWASIFLFDYVLLAIGAGFVILGIITIRRTNRMRMHPEERAGHGY
jgi:hypothetical protein